MKEGRLAMIMGSEMDKTQRLVMTALMMSLILVGTMLLRIPIPMTQGYVHLGDAMIYLGALLLGRKSGTLAAGIGSALADILGGFAVWAPWTLVIKGAMAFVAGTFIEHARADHSHSEGSRSGAARINRAAAITGMVLGGMLMCAGYFAAEGIMYGNWPVAALGIPWNIGQFAVGILISLMVSGAASRVMRSK